jgi:hypothetical protein
MKKVRFNNYSRFSRETGGYDIYAWCVFLDETAEIVNNIQMIEYTLHPTFRNPVREVTDKEHRFALQSEGWGTFKIDIRVFFEDGTEQDEGYLLRLEADDWPKGDKLNTFKSGDVEKVYRVLVDAKGDWRKASTITRATELSTARVTSILDDLASSGFARKAYFRSIENEDLWGATSRVGLLPITAST